MTLTYWQRRHLEQQLRSTRDARVYRRTLAVLEVARGEPVPSVARRLRGTPRAVYHWVATYGRDHAPAALADRDRTGRPRLLTPADRESLHELLDCSPQGMGYFAAQWTVPLLREHLTRRTGRPFSDDTLRRELQRLRYTWKRSRYTLDPDPEFGGEKRGASCGESGGCRHVASSWPRTRPTCCCSRRCGPPGRPGAAPRRSSCAGGTAGGSSSGR